MSRYLYLLRHAQSADKQPGQTDIQRELTLEGMRQAMRAAAFFQEQKSFPDAVFASTAQRARMTAEMVAERNQFDIQQIMLEEELYEASTRTFFQFITRLDNKFHQVLCVAHNPAISYLAEYLTKAEIGEIVPAGMAIIHFNTNGWSSVTEGSGDFVRYTSF